MKEKFKKENKQMNQELIIKNIRSKIGGIKRKQGELEIGIKKKSENERKKSEGKESQKKDTQDENKKKKKRKYKTNIRRKN